MFPKVKPRGTLRVKGKYSLFPVGAVMIIKCFVIPPNSKIEQTATTFYA